MPIGACLLCEAPCEPDGGGHCPDHQVERWQTDYASLLHAYDDQAKLVECLRELRDEALRAGSAGKLVITIPGSDRRAEINCERGELRVTFRSLTTDLRTALAFVVLPLEVLSGRAHARAVSGTAHHDAEWAAKLADLAARVVHAERGE